MPIHLTSQVVEAFAGVYLSPRYDNPVPTPDFHRTGWDLYVSDYPQAGLVAPRDHAKSTAFTFVFILAEVCFRRSQYVVLIGSTEENAAEQLSNIREELLNNEDLRRDFGISHLEKDSSTDVIAVCSDGHRFRILARGAEQKIRGKMWNGQRPDLLVCDDMEDDEQVESRERRAKFRRWFFRAARQAVSRTGRVRVHGTILHEDSLLSRLRRNQTWKFLFFKAHTSFDDFSNILWPEAWSKERLEARKREFIEDGDPAGYAQEYLNDPYDESVAYLQRDDFLPMSDADRAAPKRIYAAADFAVSKKETSDRTSFTVGGVCANNILYIVDQRAGRWDPLEWIEEMFVIQQVWSPEVFFVEDGVIWKAVRTMIWNEMRRRDIWINFEPILPIKDKAARGRALQKRMRARAVRFDTTAPWYPDFQYELLHFTGKTQSILDDQFDSAALLAAGIEKMGQLEPDDFIEEEEMEILAMNRRPRQEGRSLVTGY